MLILDFLKLLINLRKEVNTTPDKYIIKYSLGTLLFITLAILSDLFLPQSMLFMFIRCFVAIILGSSLFALFYGIFNLQAQKTSHVEDDIRREYSINQRINLSTIILALAITLQVIFIKPGAILYTISFSLIISIGIFLLSFIRPNRDEYLKAYYGLDDERDIAHDKIISKLEEIEKQKENKK